MKKLRILQNIWWGFVICLIFLSCNNIFDSGDFKDQLDRDIAYARSSPYEIRVECDDWAGSLISLSLLSQKVTDVFNVEFKLGSGVQFAGWKAYQKSLDGTFSELNSDYIDFISYNKESNDGIYKASVKLIKGVEGIVIKPYCFRLPKVVEITPKFESAGCDQDSPIQIKFNKAVDLESFGDFSCIQIYSENGSLDDYFGTPFLSEDKEILSIPAKSDMHILTPDTEKKLEVSVKVDFKNVTDVDGLPIVQPEPHMYRIKESYGNQEKVKVLVKSASSFGSFLSDGYKECTVGYSFDLQFTLKKSEYEFRGLEAVSTDDNSESRDNAVSFEILPESDQEAGIYKIRVSIVKSFDDILIQPKCVLLPKVTEITPKFESSGCDQNNAIKITFNKPVDTASFGDFECISIFSARGNHLDCFDKPEFSADKTVLYIKTKADKLILTPDSGQVLDITVKTDFSGVKDVDGVEIAAAEPYTYRINDSFTNQKKAKLTVKTVEGTGSFLSDGEKWCTVGYSVDLQFTVKKSEYEFRGLEAVSSSDTSIKYTDAVSFEELERNSDTGVYKIRVTVLEQKDDIVIQPKCVLLPKVLKITPEFVSTGYDQDTPISIFFNKPVDTESFGDFSCIEIYSSEGSLTGYFGTPEFSADRAVIYIRPYSYLHILTPDSDKKLDISVRLNFSKVKDQDGIALTQLEPHTYRIKDTYGNQQKVTFNVRTIDGMGTFLSDGAKSCTLGYSVDLQFNVNKSKYNFVKLEAVSSDNTSVSRSSAVNIDTISRDSENGIYKIRVTVLDNYSDILIRPVCTEKFIVKSVSPENKDGGVPRDSAILITFSDKVDPASIEGKIKITDANSSDLLSHYAEPVLINNDTTVKYSPRRDSPVITSGTAMINVNVDEGVRSANGEVLEGFDGYKFKMNSSFDSEPPLFVDFRVSKTKEGLGLKKGESQKLIGESNEYEETEDFHIRDFVWIYCKAEDKGSGAYYLTANGKKIPLTYASATDDMSANFVSTAENIYEIGPFMAEFSSDDYADGKIDVEFELYDYCDNKCPYTKVYSFIRDTEINQPYVYLYNDFAKTETYFYGRPLFWGQYEDGTYSFHEAGIPDGSRPYYDEEDFNSYYKKIYITNLSSDTWNGHSYEISAKNDVTVYYTVDGTEYKAEYSEENSSGYNSDCFIMSHFSENEDTFVRAVIQDSVGNSTEITTYIPAAGITVNYGVNSTTIEPVSSKSIINSADSVEYMYFYEFAWTKKEEDCFNQECSSIVNQLNNYSDTEWYKLANADELIENAAKRQLRICNIEENKKYIVDFYNTLNMGAGSGSVYGYGQERLSSNCIITRINFFSSAVGKNVNPTYFGTAAGFLGDVSSLVCYAVPRYKYTNINTHYVYGKPIRKNVSLQASSYSSDYTINFDLSEITSCGKNTEKSQLTISNVTILNSEGENCTNDFSLEYYYMTSSGKKYSFETSTITFPSAIVTGVTYSAGVTASLKTDETVVVNGVKDFELPVIDNYAPAPNENSYYDYHTYNLFDYDKTGKDYFIDLQWYSCAYSSTTGKKTYDNINYLFEDIGSTNWALRDATGSYAYEYYWLPYDSSSMSSELPTLKFDSEGNETFKYIRKGTSTFNWIYPLATERNTGYKMWVPVYDMEDGHYVLAIKLDDKNGNYLLKTVTYHDVETYKNPLECTLDGTTLNIKQTFGNQLKPSERNYWSSNRGTFVAGVQYFDNTSGWKEINFNKYLTDGNYASGSLYVGAANGKFIKCCVQGYQAYYTAKDQEREGRNTRGDYASKSLSIDVFNGEINSYPVYKYVGATASTFHNLLDANGGVTIFCDAPVFVHTLYSIKEDGYGSDINEWERRAREVNPVQINSTSNYYGYTDVPADAKSYVVIAHFADGTSAISNVHKK